MDNSLVRTQLESSLTLKSLGSLVKATETVMLLIDCSGSMAGYIAGSSKRRIDGLREVVAQLKQQGEVPMIRFGGPYDAQVCFVDSVPEPDGGTPLHMAIPFAKQHGANRLVVISDGMPDLGQQSRDEAVAFGGRIDVVFIGGPGEGGSFFLDDLAKLTGGTRFEGNLADIKLIANTVAGLLAGDVEPARGPIQGPGFTAAETDPEIDDVGDDPDDDDLDEEEDDDEEE